MHSLPSVIRLRAEGQSCTSAGQGRHAEKDGRIRVPTGRDAEAFPGCGRACDEGADAAREVRNGGREWWGW